MNLFRNQIDAGLKRIRQCAGEPAVYQIGTQRIQILYAIRVKVTPAEAIDETTVSDVNEQIVKIGAEELHLHGVPVEPTEGHLIIFPDATYTVLPIDGEQCFTFSGNGVSQFEISAKRKSKGK